MCTERKVNYSDNTTILKKKDVLHPPQVLTQIHQTYNDPIQAEVRALEEEKNSFESLIQRATAVNDKLDKLLAEQTKKDKLENLRR
ncbi:hypothetical protein SK128_005307, partial [Halocaridina rubra]